MSKFTLHAPGPYGAQQKKLFGYSQVMEIDGRVELSGQGGWHPVTLDYPSGVSIETEVARAFDNVAFMLNSVGLNWSHVAHVNSYHVPEADGRSPKRRQKSSVSSEFGCQTTSQSGPASVLRCLAIRGCAWKSG